MITSVILSAGWCFKFGARFILLSRSRIISYCLNAFHSRNAHDSFDVAKIIPCWWCFGFRGELPKTHMRRHAGMRKILPDIGHELIDGFNRYRAAVFIPENIAGGFPGRMGRCQNFIIFLLQRHFLAASSISDVRETIFAGITGKNKISSRSDFRC